MTTDERKIFNNGMVMGLATIGLIQTGSRQETVIYATEKKAKAYERTTTNYEGIDRTFELVSYAEVE